MHMHVPSAYRDPVVANDWPVKNSTIDIMTIPVEFAEKMRPDNLDTAGLITWERIIAEGDVDESSVVSVHCCRQSRPGGRSTRGGQNKCVVGAFKDVEVTLRASDLIVGNTLPVVVVPGMMLRSLTCLCSQGQSKSLE
jgi:hypothetical protein